LEQVLQEKDDLFLDGYQEPSLKGEAKWGKPGQIVP
jgi:hypothetical protein